MEDEYDFVIKKPLKLTSKKATPKRSESESDKNNEPKVIITTATKAEQSFKSKQNKTAEGRILKKASKTHKQRVEEFNKHLDSLSEHYDIPKVSWTK